MPEPTIRVGLATGRTTARLTFRGRHSLEVDGRSTPTASGPVQVTAEGGRLRVTLPSGERPEGREARWLPGDPGSTAVLHSMAVGLDFHWEQQEDLVFPGAISLEIRQDGTFDVVNVVSLEAYLRSVIASEMSARCPTSFLQAHAVISRSWLLAQLERSAEPTTPPGQWEEDGVIHVERWYDREDHAWFDVCADDHCQRYQGVTRAGPAEDAARGAVESTKGLVLAHGGATCDARFYKCCGGMTERFGVAWGGEGPACLVAVPDFSGPVEGFTIPLSVEENARAFIEGWPPALCGTRDQALLERILPEMDHATGSFYRWEERLTQEALRDHVQSRTGIDPGPVRALVPIERGDSGRIHRLMVDGERHRLVIGRELEIRRVLSSSHLYSSAFVADPVGAAPGALPPAFRIRGAGWGHGVGLCQVGAAVMAEHGTEHRSILGHYYPDATLEQRYL